MLKKEIETIRLILTSAVIYVLFLSYYYIYFEINFFSGIQGNEGLWQFLPFDTLKNHPVESLFFLHSRVPLGNILLGIGLNTGIGENIFAYFNHICGLLIFIYSFLFINFFTKRLILTEILFSLFIYSISLNFLAFLSSILYTLSTATFLLALSWHVFQYFQYEKKSDLIASILFSILISLNRETYGIMFLLILFLIFFMKSAKSVLYCLSTFPIILLSLKNYLVFGFWGATTLFGMTFFINTNSNAYKIENSISKAEFENGLIEIRDKHPDLSPLLIGFIKKISDYEKAGFITVKNPEFEKIPALMRHEKPDWWGASNKNAYEYIQISREYERLNAILLKKFPGNYLRNVYIGLVLFFKPSWMFLQTVQIKHNTHPHLFAHYKLPGVDSSFYQKYNVSISKGYDLFPLCYFFILGILFLSIFNQYFFSKLEASFFLVIIGFGTAGAVLITHIETMRYKFEIEPLVLCLVFAIAGKSISLGIDRLYKRKF